MATKAKKAVSLTTTKPAATRYTHADAKRAERLRAREGALTAGERAWLDAYEKARPRARQTLQQTAGVAPPAPVAAAPATTATAPAPAPSPAPLELAVTDEQAAKPAPAAATPSAAAAAPAAPRPTSPAPLELATGGAGGAADAAAANAAARDAYAQEIAEAITNIALGWNDRAMECGAKDQTASIERGIRPLAHAVALEVLPQDLGPAGKHGKKVALGASMLRLRWQLYRIESSAHARGLEPRRQPKQLEAATEDAQPAAAAEPAAAAPAAARAAASGDDQGDDDDDTGPKPGGYL